MGRALLIISFIISVRVFAQQLPSHTGVIRGKIIDSRSRIPIHRARVVLNGTKLGAITNESGEFRIKDIPVGHYILHTSAAGYAASSQEVIVGSAHQIVVEVPLEEKVFQGDTLTVTGTSALSSISTTAAVSAMPFNITDVNRYAGGFQDPSRMAQNFAGVFGRGTSTNHIVVRGGSPIEVLWRLDGIDIPNPNHFGKNGSSGGLISAINSAMLGNSDFLTGAFPAEYGTRMSAVFDMHTRNGNTEQMEATLQVSIIGSELLFETPIPKLTGNSVLVSYRHSTLSFLRELDILDYDELPDFDDAMMKLHFKLGDADQLNVTTIWGDARINDRNTANSEIGSGSGLIVSGGHWQHIFSKQFITNVHVHYVRNRYNEGLGDRTERVTIGYITFKADAQYLASNSQAFSAGISAQQLNAELANGRQSNAFNNETMIYQSFLNWNWHIVESLLLNSGVFFQYIDYNARRSFEPRVSLAWTPIADHTIATAYGIHRQPQPLEFTQAEHIVLGYTWSINPNLIVKIEGYQKKYSDVPIHTSTRDSYSFLNQGFAERIDFDDLINRGKGKSYGAELSLFKHYDEGYYLTATASYVRQLFAGSDNIWRFGSFDNRYIFNILSGYDLLLSNNSSVTLSEKFTIAGSGTYTPVDLEASRSAGYTIYDTAHPYSDYFPPYVRVDINAEFHFNWETSRFTVYASILNALNYNNVIRRYYSSLYDKVNDDYDVPIIPVIGLKYEF